MFPFTTDHSHVKENKLHVSLVTIAKPINGGGLIYRWQPTSRVHRPYFSHACRAAIIVFGL